MSCDRVEWASALVFRYQCEVNHSLAGFSIGLIMSRSCSDYQPIKERNYDDFPEPKSKSPLCLDKDWVSHNGMCFGNHMEYHVKLTCPRKGSLLTRLFEYYNGRT